MMTKSNPLQALLRDDPQGQRQALAVGVIVFFGFWLYRLLLTGGGRPFFDAAIAGIIAYVAAFWLDQQRSRTSLPIVPHDQQGRDTDDSIQPTAIDEPNDPDRTE